jgi:ATP-dependent RNA helicase RhlE
MNSVTNPDFAALGVSEPLLRALEAENYHTPTPIQTQAIPPLLAGRDVVGIAQTGTGKTAAFALPILQRLSETPGSGGAGGARALILAPTRELAIQIAESIATYGRHLNLRHAVIFGGVGQDPQVKALARGVDILVATPGRLLDLINQRHIRLDLRKIVSTLPGQRQSLLFSATMPPDITKLAEDLLNRPVRVEVSPAVVTVEAIDQRVFFVDAASKRALLNALLNDQDLARVIVFTRTKHGANRVVEHLDKAGVAAEALHGNKSQSARQRALARFRSGDARVLVATDIAARGIDVDDVTHVINYELPNIPESYVHRVGRTARAGARGIALSFCDPSERTFLRDIEKLTRRPLAVVAGHPAMAAAAAAIAAAPPERRTVGPAPDRRESGGYGSGRPVSAARSRPGSRRAG